MPNNLNNNLAVLFETWNSICLHKYYMQNFSIEETSVTDWPRLVETWAFFETAAFSSDNSFEYLIKD